jgi:pyruvate/2-oxoglutarate dehydrogenase complex dihydrolipoamide acyltransferase (E2) component
MATEFKLPDVGEGTDAAELVEWHVAVGDTVAEDQPLVDVQTDKAIVEIPCPVAGTVLSVAGEEGDRIPIGTVLAVFGEAGESSPAGTGAAATRAPAAPDRPPAPNGAAAATSPANSSAGGEQEPSAVPLSPAATGRPLASPAVRRLARERGVDLREIAGSGPSGRILREDLDAPAAVPSVPPEGPAVPSPAGRAAAAREDEVLPLRGTRRVIAHNMVQAWQSIPHIIDFREADLTNLLAARRGLRERGAELSTFALLAKIAATAAGRHPEVNASIDLEREEITVHGAVHLAVAIAAPDGLVTPVVRDADRKSAIEIAAEITALAEAARNRRLKVGQLSGGTLTVNNYGALGSTFSTPIIPPGQVINLGFGKLEERPKAEDGEVVVRPMQWVTCSGDHRALDGEHLATYVNEVVAMIEEPTLLLADLA